MAVNGQTFELPKKPNLTDDLFSTQESRDSAKLEKVVDIALSEIDSFPEHPFSVKEDEALLNMVESIKAFGVITPAVVRKKDDGRYELVSGHRRKRACEIAEVETIPVIVREMNRDEAIIFMVDSNLQREIILPSEKAKSYQMRLEAMKRQGQRTDLTSAPMVQKSENKTSREILAEKSGDSHEQVRRYVRLNSLVPEILSMVDEGKMAFRPAVELSYLPKEQQQELLTTIETEEATPSLAQAIKMKKFAQENRLNEDVILSIMSEEKPNQKEQIKIPRERINKYFKEGTPADKITEIIIKALDFYRKREREDRNER